MKQNIFKKYYIAIVEGILKQKCGTINLNIERKPNSIIERQVVTDGTGDTSITHYKVIKKEKDYSVVQILLETGRTHQIRVHFSYIGHPVLGDTLYGHASSYITRQALHAYKVTFIHPITKEEIIIISPLSTDISNLI